MAGQSAGTDKKTILVVDDDPTILSLLAKVLLSKGYDVLLAEHGGVAEKILKAQHVDLMITDIKMEPIDGVQLLEIVQKKYPGLPAIALNPYITVPLIDICAKLGVYDFIGVPFKIEEMLLTVSHALAYGEGCPPSTAEDAMPAFIEAMEYKLHHCRKILREKRDEPNASSPIGKKRKTVLNIEDDPMVRKLVGQTIEGAGNHVLYADNGNTGLEILEANHVDLVMTGYVPLRGPDGIEVIEAIRNKDPYLPVLLHSACGHLPTALYSIKLGAFDYLDKPFTPDIPRMAVKYALAYGAGIRAGAETPEFIEAKAHKWENFKRFMRTKSDEEVLAALGTCETDVPLAELITKKSDNSFLEDLVGSITDVTESYFDVLNSR